VLPSAKTSELRPNQTTAQPKFKPINLCIILSLLVVLNVQLLAYRSLVVSHNAENGENNDDDEDSRGPKSRAARADILEAHDKRKDPRGVDARLLQRPAFPQFQPDPRMMPPPPFQLSQSHAKNMEQEMPQGLKPPFPMEKTAPSFEGQKQIPTKPPSPISRDATSSSSYSPTQITRLWRLQQAKADSVMNSNFWKTNIPDPIPPLPPDVDPKTGEKLPPVIAYVTTLTKCLPASVKSMVDGAAVLLHSIRRNSYGWIPINEQIKMDSSPSQNFDPGAWPNYGGKGGRYRFRAYVIIDPEASSKHNEKDSGECARVLQKLGYTVLHRPPLVPLFEVENVTEAEIPDPNNSFYEELRKSGYVGEQRPKEGPMARSPQENPNRLRRFLHTNGCCGYAELLKLHVFGMTAHKLAVHLDFDSLLLRPMDDLFDVMLGKTMMEDVKDQSPLPVAKGPHTKVPDFNKPIHAAFTRDYNSVKDPNPDAPVGIQGGFLVVKPSLEVLDRFKTILRRGEFLLDPRKGWGGKFGGFEGDMTFQGILPYYYEMVAPEGEHNEIELDRCIYNQMADNPRKSTHRFPRATPLDPEKMGFSDTTKCRDGREDCSDTDCQRVHPRDSVTAHFTFCHKPWDCSDGLPGTVAHETCSVLLREWYGVRRELEDWWLLKDPNFKRAKTWWDNIDDQRNLYWKAETVDQVYEHRSGSLNVSTYLGYCDSFGENGYRSLTHPDGWFEEQEKAVKKELKHQHKLENAINKPW